MPSRGSSVPSSAATGPVTQKALGKRKANATVDGAPPPARHKTRVLPSRLRRVGGPGIGSSEIDEIILDSQRRKFENDPLFPLDTRFIITTNEATLKIAVGEVSLVESPAVQVPEPVVHLELNQDAMSRYFDRPEVIKACREQQEIQTPEFRRRTDDVSVGSRFRTRSQAEEKVADTSDEAYEKRHRKYEVFEKRLRQQEKEKLRHLQYKLRERIEQLRTLDVSTFLALPASNFSPAPHLVDTGVPIGDLYDSEDALGLLHLPGANVNGAAAYNEGQRRREEMLANALALEEKYVQLLPPDRPRPPTKKALQAAAEAEEGTIVLKSAAGPSTSTKKTTKKPQVKAHVVSASSDESEVDDLESEEENEPPVIQNGRRKPQPKPIVLPATNRRNSRASAILSPSIIPETTTSPSASSHVLHDAMDVDNVEFYTPGQDGDHDESASVVHRNKRWRAESTDDPQASTSMATSSKRKNHSISLKVVKKPSQLEKAAVIMASRNGRQARNVQAFGYDIPAAVDMKLQFDFPMWAHPEGRPSKWFDHIQRSDSDEDTGPLIEDGDPPNYPGDLCIPTAVIPVENALSKSEEIDPSSRAIAETTDVPHSLSFPATSTSCVPSRPKKTTKTRAATTPESEDEPAFDAQVPQPTSDSTVVDDIASLDDDKAPGLAPEAPVVSPLTRETELATEENITPGPDMGVFPRDDDNHNSYSVVVATMTDQTPPSSYAAQDMDAANMLTMLRGKRLLS